MKTNEALIRHEILNLFTLMHFLLGTEKNIEKNKKGEMRQLIHLASLLVGYERVFIEGETDFFMETFDVRDTLEILSIIHEEKTAKVRLSIEPLREKAMVSADKVMTKELLDVILKELYMHCHSIRLSFDANTAQLFIHHDGPSLNIKNFSLLECLRQKNMRVRERILMIVIRLAEGTGIQTKSKTGEVVLKFTGFLYNPKNAVNTQAISKGMVKIGGDARNRTGVQE